MKYKLLSAIVGTDACIASCPFCVSGVLLDCKNMICPETNWRNFDICCNIANRSDVDTVMLTSRGEPLLFPDQITAYLEYLQKHHFPFIELQSNLIPVGMNFNKYNDYLKKWYELGLTTICISVVSENKEKNQRNYTPDGNYMDLSDVIRRLHEIGYSIRLACVLCKGITHTIEEVKKVIMYAKSLGVEQLTLRPVNNEFRRESAAEWIKNHCLTVDDKQAIQEYLQTDGTILLNLDRIGCVYDVNGQNVMFSEPLNKDTRDIDPENGRQLIFFPDGHIRYEWEKEGGILL